MKVLYVDHPEADFLAAQIYMGLCRVLGAENVIDYPYKATYHGDVHRYASPYTTDPGTTPWSRWEQGGDGLTTPFDWMEPQPGRRVTRDEVLGMIGLGEIAIVIVASPRAYNVPAAEDLIRASGKLMPPVVLIDGEDYTTIRYDIAERLGVRTYFKRELVAESEQVEVYHAEKARIGALLRVEPLPLAPVRVMEWTHTTVDVVLLGGGNCPGGKEPYEAVVRAVTDSYILGHVPFDRFLSAVSSARIAVALRGHSQDSLRSWEMLACEGPLVAVHRHTLIRPHPFLDGVHVADFGSPSELEAVLRKYLADEPRRASIAHRGHVNLLEHHTAEARARYLLEKAIR